MIEREKMLHTNVLSDVNAELKGLNHALRQQTYNDSLSNALLVQAIYDSIASGHKKSVT